MKKNEPITHIMTEVVETVHTRQKPSEVRALLSEHSFHHVPVVDGERLVGILSSTDMMRISFASYMGDDRAIDAWLDHEYTIEQIMQKDVTTLSPKSSVRDAAQLLSRNHYHSIPIVDEGSGNLRGIVTSVDIINYLLEHY